MGEDTIAKLLPELATRAGYSQRYTGQNIRVTEITSAAQAGMSDNDMMSKMHHKSVEGLNTYKRPTANHSLQVGRTLQLAMGRKAPLVAASKLQPLAPNTSIINAALPHTSSSKPPSSSSAMQSSVVQPVTHAPDCSASHHDADKAATPDYDHQEPFPACLFEDGASAFAAVPTEPLVVPEAGVHESLSVDPAIVQRPASLAVCASHHAAVSPAPASHEHQAAFGTINGALPHQDMLTAFGHTMASSFPAIWAAAKRQRR